MPIENSKRLQVALTALRGVVMIAAGIAAFVLPAQAVAVVLIIGGGLLVVDGGLGLASMDYSSRRVQSFYLALARNLLGLAAGAIILASGMLTGLFTLSFLATTAGLLVILAGLIEVGSVAMNMERYDSPMMAMAGGGLYIAAGLLLMFLPLSSAAVLMRLATILLIAYAVSLLYRAWRIRAASPDAG